MIFNNVWIHLYLNLFCIAITDKRYCCRMRNKDLVWQHFERDKFNGKNIKATCKKCGKTFHGHLRRLKDHL